jgi:hypothetical protein
MSMTIVIYIGKAAVTKLIEAGFKKAMGVEVRGSIRIGNSGNILGLQRLR